MRASCKSWMAIKKLLGSPGTTLIPKSPDSVLRLKYHLHEKGLHSLSFPSTIIHTTVYNLNAFPPASEDEF